MCKDIGESFGRARTRGPVRKSSLRYGLEQSILGSKGCRCTTEVGGIRGRRPTASILGPHRLDSARRRRRRSRLDRRVMAFCEGKETSSCGRRQLCLPAQSDRDEEGARGWAVWIPKERWRLPPIHLPLTQSAALVCQSPVRRVITAYRSTRDAVGPSEPPVRWNTDRELRS